MVKFFKRYLTLLIIIPINIGAVMNSDIQISNYKVIGEQIVDTATNYIGVKYRYGHSSPNGFDCSGLTQYVYNKHGIKISRTAKDQYKQGEKVKKNELQSGDLVFFQGKKSKGVRHVGIVVDTLENGQFKFIHASCSKGVRISYSYETYYKIRYIGARRILV